MSKPFTVHSAKKFPGMCESTELSKKFAQQGIRIPVRHAGDKNTGSEIPGEDIDVDEAEED
jgi:hypothetical protein